MYDFLVSFALYREPQLPDKNSLLSPAYTNAALVEEEDPFRGLFEVIEQGELPLERNGSMNQRSVNYSIKRPTIYKIPPRS